MNILNFIQAGGFPMDVNTLDQMQTAYRLFNGLGQLAGDLSIIKGCEPIGSSVSDGLVYINGEVLEFRSGVVQDTVIIVQEAQSKEFENGSTNEVHYTRYATFGVSTTNYNWEDFKRPLPMNEVPEALDLKEDKTTVDALIERINDLEQIALTIPKIKITTGTQLVNSPSGGQKHSDFSKNYVYVYPPVGFDMNNLAGFMPSINTIEFSGDVNNDDTLWCKYRVEESRVTIICSNSETRGTPSVSYMAVWIKY
jgi:hypothetical protein